MGALGDVRSDARPSTAATAAVIVVAVVVAAILVGTGMLARASGSVAWQDASLPTYPADEWNGVAAPLADGLSLEIAVGVTLCPEATLLDGGATTAVILADSWHGAWPLATGFVEGEPTPRLDGGPAGIEIAPGPDTEVAVAGRLLDLADADDAALARAWTDVCGPADRVAQASPDGLAVRAGA